MVDVRFTSRACPSIDKKNHVAAMSFIFGAYCQSVWKPSNVVPDVLTDNEWKQIDRAISGVPIKTIIQTVSKTHTSSPPGSRLVQTQAGKFGIGPNNLALLETYHLETLVLERFNRVVKINATDLPRPSDSARARVLAWLKDTGNNLESAVIETLMLEMFCGVKTPFTISIRANKDATRYICYRDFDRACPQPTFIPDIELLMRRTPPQFMTAEFNKTLYQIAAGLAIVTNFVETHADFKTSVTHLGNVEDWCPPNAIFWHETLGIYMRAGDCIYHIPSGCVLDTVYGFITTLSTIHNNKSILSTAHEFATDVLDPNLIDY